MEMKTLEELHGNDKQNTDRAIKGEMGRGESRTLQN